MFLKGLLVRVIETGDCLAKSCYGALMFGFGFEMIKTVVRGENAGYCEFSPFLTMFLKDFFPFTFKESLSPLPHNAHFS